MKKSLPGVAFVILSAASALAEMRRAEIKVFGMD